jgi:transcriptional regulator with XRE-family HTH domain
MRELTLTKADLARLTNLSDGYLGRLANDKGTAKGLQIIPSPDTVQRLAKHLQISRLEIVIAVGFLEPETLTNVEEARLLEFFRATDREHRADTLEYAAMIAARHGVKKRRKPKVLPPGESGPPVLSNVEPYPRGQESGEAKDDKKLRTHFA